MKQAEKQSRGTCNCLHYFCNTILFSSKTEVSNLFRPRATGREYSGGRATL